MKRFGLGLLVLALLLGIVGCAPAAVSQDSHVNVKFLSSAESFSVKDANGVSQDFLNALINVDRTALDENLPGWIFTSGDNSGEISEIRPTGSYFEVWIEFK